MTMGPTDDSAARDPRFDAAWRAASNEEPPAALDAAILAAARREVGAKPQSLAAHAAMRARRRWWPLAAAATVAVIAIGVVQRVGHDELVAPPGDSTIVTDMPKRSATSTAESSQRVPEAQAPAPDPRAIPAPSANGGAAEGRARSDSTPGPKAKPDAQFAARTDTLRSYAAKPVEKKSESVASPAAPLPEPFPAAPPPSASAARDSDSATVTPAPVTAGNIAAAEQSAARGAAQRQESDASAKPAAPSTPAAAPRAPAAAPQPPMPPAPSFADRARMSTPSAMRSAPVAKTATAEAAPESRIKDHPPLPVVDWIALIRRLRGEGQTIEAARELAAFRTAHADHEKLLPADLRDWHPAEK